VVQGTKQEIEIIEAWGSTDLALPLKPEENPVIVYLASLSEGSRRGQVSSLACALAIARGEKLGDLTRDQSRAVRREVYETDWSRLTHGHMAAIRTALQDAYAPASCNKHLSAIRGVLKSCWRLGLLTMGEYARCVDIPKVKGDKAIKGRYIEDREVMALLLVCDEDKSVSGLRDGVMLTVGLGIGCRVAEIHGLDLADYDQKTGEILITGKGNRDRINWADNELDDAFKYWLVKVRGDEAGPMFCPIDFRAGLIKRTEEGGIPRMSPWSIQKRLKIRAKQAGVEPFSWHDLRRTHISNCLDLGIDLATVAKNVGHSSVETTASYDRRPDRARRQAMTKLRIPWKARWNGRE